MYGSLDVKLGEYLALGKAIISTPVPWQLPSNLEHGTHIHVIDGSEESMKEAIEHIVCEPAYRLHLEANARADFDKFSSPRAIIQRSGIAGVRVSIFLSNPSVGACIR